MTQIAKKDLVDTSSPELEVVKNDKGVSILKCCMSCEHKSINTFGFRKCKVHNRIVEKYDICDKWMLGKGYLKAGKGEGYVDPHCYEKFLEKREKMTDEQAYLHGFSKEWPNEASKQ